MHITAIPNLKFGAVYQTSGRSLAQNLLGQIGGEGVIYETTPDFQNRVKFLVCTGPHIQSAAILRGRQNGCRVNVGPSYAPVWRGPEHIKKAARRANPHYISQLADEARLAQGEIVN